MEKTVSPFCKNGLEFQMNKQDIIGKIVKFNGLIEDIECDFDSGMRAKIVDIRDSEDCIKVFFDTRDFIEHNKSVEKPNYWNHMLADKSKKTNGALPLVKLSETTLYNEFISGRNVVYFENIADLLGRCEVDNDFSADGIEIGMQVSIPAGKIEGARKGKVSAISWFGGWCRFTGEYIMVGAPTFYVQIEGFEHSQYPTFFTYSKVALQKVEKTS